MGKMKLIKRCLILGLLAISLSACSNKEVEKTGTKNVVKDDEYVVKMSYNSGLCQAPFQMALELGYFEKEGLKYELIKSEGYSSDLIASGKADTFTSMLPSVIQQIDNGVDVNMTVGVHTGCLKVVAKADSGINKIEDLKGKKVGVPGLATPPAIITYRALAAKGIGTTPENMQVEFLVFTPSELQLALEEGRVDAIAASDPIGAIVAKNGAGKVILDTTVDEEYKNEFCCVSLLRPDFVKEHPKLAEKYTKALMKGAKYVEEHPEEVAKFQIDNKLVSNDDLEMNIALLKSYNFISSIDGGKEALKRNFKDLQGLKLISQDLDIDKIVNKVYVEFKGLK
ncbi:ABC-type nitrate/sulfonate/bicarbonate transport system, periplasmic component [Gottschalkia purinilytica]|uniref:ABC-type nitrate/sulfonate/bicarbonate transport system, periplasmic component n=1 Tax=Gottschalkia purinilytica TaxID=1503 RepID=A0A0L0WC55_GOTPU|nr:ABC transporter substrate-binding protein [Gottschalkia purinilytica]KNF09053.1 ABC-type nitrate/sulfonate/bicarbonate transport system, periplasmic component [Gottschalkia purinilytica]